MQLDNKERGFSFLKEGDLDMRMDSHSNLTAKEIINRYSEKELGKIFRDFGEERNWKIAAKAIVQARKKKSIETTTELADIISSSIKGARRKRHPATLIFQALRVCVNRELDSIQEGVSKAIKHLAPKGRIGVISFHSLEDRIVKNVLKEVSEPIKNIVRSKEKTYLPLIKLLSKKPLVPNFEESKVNKRARSAKLRVAEKI